MNFFEIKVKVQGTMDYVSVSEDDIVTRGNFLCRVAEHFKINDDEDIEALILDNHGTEIPEDKFMIVLKQFSSCGAFFVDVQLLNRPKTSSAQKLRQFLGSKDYESVFTEYQSCGFLTKKNRKKLVNALYIYILQDVSPSPSENDLIAVCNDMLVIFPRLKFPNSTIGGMDLYYNPDTRNGFLANKFKNHARQLNDSLAEEVIANELSDEKKEEYALFFRTCVVAKQTEEIKNKLRETAPYRKSMMNFFENDFKNVCKFYFAMPDLILFDFEVLFGSEAQNTFEERWADMVKKLHIRFKVDVANDVIPVSDVDFLNFVGLLKRFSVPRVSIKTAIASILTFSKSPTDDPMKLMSSKNVSPNIIVVWSTESNARKYYIDVKKLLISVPENYTAVQTLDLLFKASKVFNIDLHKYVAPLFCVFEKYIYGMKLEKEITPKHLEDAELLFTDN